MDETGLWRFSASELAAGYAAREFTPVDAVRACLLRIGECQPAVNAFVHVDEAGALAAARASAMRWAGGKALGPLDGVPVSLKDNLHARGMPTTWGSRLLKRSMQQADELPVARLRGAGAVLLGKTNLPEFALQGITDNLVAGATRNPWDTSLTPGGSSGGGAAAVACGCGPLALVTDGGGSARRPASHTGLVGFKPSGGCVARGGGLPGIFLEYEVPGVLARRVADVRSMIAVLGDVRSADADDSPARVLFVPSFGEHPVDPDIALRVRQAAAHLASLGIEVEEAPRADWADEINRMWPAFSAAGLAWMLDDASRFAEFGLAAGQAPDLSLCGAAALASLRLGQEARGTELFAALQATAQLRSRMDAIFSRHDFILTPATAAMPWPLGAPGPSQIDGRAVGPRGHAVFTAFANAAGLPAVALPCGFVDGLPTGFQLVAARGEDARLLALALVWEQAFPWQGDWPDPLAATMPAHDAALR